MTTPYRPGDGLNQFATSMPPTVHPGPSIQGVGSPEGAVPANPGTAYVDSIANALWVKEAGVGVLGWKLVGQPWAISGTSTNSGNKQVFSGSGSPVGVITPTTDEAFYIQSNSTPPGVIWEYYSGSWH